MFLNSPEHLFARGRAYINIIVTQKSRKSQKGRPLVAESKVTQITQMAQILTADGQGKEKNERIFGCFGN